METITTDIRLIVALIGLFFIIGFSAGVRAVIKGHKYLSIHDD